MASAAVPASAADVTITVENLAPSNGLFVTPVWVGLHDGSFDLFDPGSAVPAGGFIERIAEDGDLAPLRTAFAAAVPSGVDEVVFGPTGIGAPPVLDPGESNAVTLTVDGTAGRYLSFASMVVPSNDAFIGNANPMAYEIFDAVGNFLGPRTITIMGSMIWDAGTEANTEMDAAFINQTGPDMGTTTAEAVMLHPGFIGSLGNPGGTPIILGSSNGLGATFGTVAADFTQPGYVLARITVVPEPVGAGLLALAAPLLVRRRRAE